MCDVLIYIFRILYNLLSYRSLLPRLRVRMERWDVRGDAVVLQHVEQRRLTRVVQPQEEDLRILVAKTQVAEHIEEP